MAAKSIQQLIDAELNGQTWFATWRKTPSQTTGAGIWFDLSMSPGNPVPNYYAAAPGVAIALAQSTDYGIPHGGNVKQLGLQKYLKTFMLMSQTATAVPMSSILCDYLMYYPFVDMSITGWGQQPPTTNIALPRNPVGSGVQIMAVVVAAPSGAGNPQFQVQYTNSKGVTGCVTPVITTNTQTVNGTIVTTATATAGTAGPFLPLAPGDSGVQKIEDFNFITPDIGLLSFVLVDPLENINMRTIDAPAERTPITDFADLPIISDDAYLNLICCPNGTLAAAPIHGYIQTVWA